MKTRSPKDLNRIAKYKALVNAMHEIFSCKKKKSNKFTVNNIAVNKSINKQVESFSFTMLTHKICVFKNKTLSKPVLSWISDEACYHFIEENGIQVLSSLLSKKPNCVEDREILLFAANALSRISSILGKYNIVVPTHVLLHFCICSITLYDTKASQQAADNHTPFLNTNNNILK